MVGPDGTAETCLNTPYRSYPALGPLGIRSRDFNGQWDAVILHALAGLVETGLQAATKHRVTEYNPETGQPCRI